jgi:hypothetical protein
VFRCMQDQKTAKSLTYKKSFFNIYWQKIIFIYLLIYVDLVHNLRISSDKLQSPYFMEHLLCKTIIVEPAEPKMHGVIVNHLEN